MPDGPPVKRGLPYSAIAHLAEDAKPFVAMAMALRGRGLSAPKIFAADHDAGYAVIEDLGTEPWSKAIRRSRSRNAMNAPLTLLIELHRHRLPEAAADRAASDVHRCRPMISMPS